MEMEKGDDMDMVMKGAHVLDRAKDEVVAITDSVHGALHSVKIETEEKAERLKGGLKHLLHKAKAKAKAPPFYDKAKADIKDHLLSINFGQGQGQGQGNHIHDITAQGQGQGQGQGEGNVESTHPAPAETGFHTNKEGQTNSSPADHESTSIPVQVIDANNNKEGDDHIHNNFLPHFAQFFQKCCQPFNNKKD